MENQTHVTHHAETKAVAPQQRNSKLAIFLFVISLISILGTLFGGVSYSSTLDFIVNIVVSLLIIYWAYYAEKRAIKNNLGAVKLVHFAMYAFAAVLIVEIIGAIALMGSSKSLREFAKNETPTFFSGNLEGLKENATEDLKKVLSDGTVAAVKKEFADVGTINNCIQEKDDSNEVSFGGTPTFNSFEYGLNGNYTISCYGEKKPFTVTAQLKRENGAWKVDDYTFNTKLENRFNEDEAKDAPIE